MWKIITESIVDEIRESIFLFILADEAFDVSRLEEQALVLRFVVKSSFIRETFHVFFHCSDGDIADVIFMVAEDLGVHLSFFRGQGYGNMAGKCNSTSALRHSRHPKALFVHC